jgi:hypothetical protein
MGMTDRLPEDAMFPEDCRSIKAGKKLLYLVLQGKQFVIHCGWNISIAGIVLLRYNEQVSLDKRGMIGSKKKIRSFFENIGDVITITKSTMHITHFGIQGVIFPISHQICSICTRLSL